MYTLNGGYIMYKSDVNEEKHKERIRKLITFISLIGNIFMLIIGICTIIYGVKYWMQQNSVEVTVIETTIEETQ